MLNIDVEQSTWRMKQVTTMRYFAIVLVGSLVLMGVIQLNFDSPIENGLNPVRASYPPYARRLVLIVADGLRAKEIFGQDGMALAPNLWDRRTYRGAWGVSHTRVPTESRPGHVAILGGIYEDPSALFKGWQSNPVPFDTILNESSYAYCWGSPDIIGMFNQTTGSQMYSDTYSSTMQNFGYDRTSELDQWVFQRLRIFLKERLYCRQCDDVTLPKSIFFLHLLGIDTAGHGFKPNSKEYNANIKFVDDHIPFLEDLFTKTFRDLNTAYLFTSDHGMTDWGSHGAGTSDETETPFIVWGSGIYRVDLRQDLNQVDIASFVAALLGTNIPTNSMGSIPFNFLDASDGQRKFMTMANLLQLKQIYDVKRERVVNNAIYHYPYLDGLDLEAIYNELEKFDIRYNTADFFTKSKQLIEHYKIGIEYYHNYYKLPVMICLSIGVVLWIVYLLTFGFPVIHRALTTKQLRLIFVTSLTMLGSGIWLIYIQKLPLTFYAYFSFPVIMGTMLALKYKHLVKSYTYLTLYRYFWAECVFMILVLASMVMIFADRDYLMVTTFLFTGYVLLGADIRQKIDEQTKSHWILSTWFMILVQAYVAFKPRFNPIFYMVGYFIWAYANSRFEKLVRMCNPIAERSFTIIGWQRMIFNFAPLYTLAVHIGFIGPDSPFKILATIMSILPLLMTPAAQTNPIDRFCSGIISLLPFYMNVAFSHELIFLALYTYLVYLWFHIEFGALQAEPFVQLPPPWKFKHVVFNDYRRALTFLYFIFLGFFGIGFNASLNTFDPMWTKCFLTAYKPFLMTFIIVTKMCIPFIVTIIGFRYINLYRFADPAKMFCIVTGFAYIMILILMFKVRNTGSWLEIGTSLSNFIIMVLFSLVTFFLHTIVGKYITYEYPLWFRNHFVDPSLEDRQVREDRYEYY